MVSVLRLAGSAVNVRMQLFDRLFRNSRNRLQSAGERSNEQWLNELHGDRRDAALDDLRLLLLRGLRHGLRSRGRLESGDLEDFVQDGLVRVLENLDSFRGESRFTTWAQKITMRVAFSEMRRRRWQEVSLDQLLEQDEGRSPLQVREDPAADPGDRTQQQMALALLRSMIQQELTERQRTALLAVMVHGMPMEEVARKMDTNRNALYKLLHDARRRLRRGFEHRGLRPEDLLSDL